MISFEKYYTAVTAVFLCMCFVIIALVLYILTEKHRESFGDSVCCCWPRKINQRVRSYGGLSLRPSHSAVLDSRSVPKDLSSATYHDVASEDDL